VRGASVHIDHGREEGSGQMIRKALISVSDKTRIEVLLKALSELGVEIISSGGTAQHIWKLGYRVTEVTEYTGYPEMPGGLVKTLHPKIHGGILGDAKDPGQREYMEKQGISEIDLVVVNLYPFEKQVSEKKPSLKEAAEYIDIGGPALVRAAAKAALLHGRVTILTKPSQYAVLVEQLKKRRGEVSDDFKRKLAQEAFALTASYDQSIREYLKATL